MPVAPKTDLRARILLIGPNWLGDALFLTPAIRAIRRRFPEAYLAVLAPARVREVLSGNPHLNEIILYNDRAGLLHIFHTLGLLIRLKKTRFDSVFLFHRSKTKAVFAWMAGIRHRIGFDTGTFLRRQFLTHAFEHPESKGKGVHRVDMYLRLAEDMGIVADGRWTEYVVGSEFRSRAEQLLREAGIDSEAGIVTVHVGANWALKRWPAECFARWVILFRQKSSQPVIFCGTPKETPVIRRIVELAGESGLYDFSGKTAVGDLAALLELSAFFVSNDSGPLHLAVSVGTPAVGIFGPTLPAITAPIGRRAVRVLWKDVGCRVPCYFRACNYRVCMDRVSPEEVMKACEETFDKKNRAEGGI